ncbi:MAG TPA: DMT family transporter [Solirubrobacteraceae bacterium]|nr:DMT family transporter [Solirubrobacteraceae bacterium]
MFRSSSKFLPSLVPAFGWGAMFPIADSAIDHVDPFHLTAIRYLIASLAFLALLWAFEGVRALRLDGRGLELFFYGSAGFAGFNLLAFAGLEHTTPEHVALIVATSPLITLLASAALARRAPSVTTLGFAIVALAGLLLVIGHGDPLTLFHGGVNGGDLLVLLGTISFVGYTLGARRFSDWSALRYTALSAPLGTITVVAVTGVATLAGWYAAPSAGDVAAIWWQLLYVIVIGALAAVLGWNEGVRRLGAPNAALFMNLVPVVAFAIAIGRGYHPDGAELGGAAITVAALIGANLAARQEIARPVRAAWATTRSANPAKSRA